MPNPFLDREPLVSLRDPAAVFHDGVYHCFHTAVEGEVGTYRLFVDVTESRDLVRWSAPKRLTAPGLNFSSPGNVLRRENQWVLCVQSYPTRPGASYGSDESRLWTMRSSDLAHWEEPRLLQPLGCQAAWANSRWQIDSVEAAASPLDLSGC